jgi:hypothetical protein
MIESQKINMKAIHLYEVRMIDGSRYRGEIAYRDDRMIVLRQYANHGIGNGSSSNQYTKIRLFSQGIISINELGWRRRLQTQTPHS